jgi:alkanesulfonate monooxygenase SsuD/methylene tetrahydromethanopterin reductase-like flavin-dependent oxidoreductase (luciferase family)
VTGAVFDNARAVARSAGRTSPLIYSVAQTVCVGRDDAEVARRAEVIGEDPEQLRAEGLGGTPNQVIDKLGHFAELGASRAYLQVLDLGDLEHLELIASAVAPQVAAL